MNNIIGIMGCGWLGFALAKSLIADEFIIKGTTTTEKKVSVLSKAGINAFHVSITGTNIKGAIDDFLEECDVLIINVPPGLRGKGPKESYLDKMKRLIEPIKKSTVKKIIFVSSTSVYGDEQGKVTEKTRPIPTSESGKQLLESERLFQNQTDFKTTIVRFGGLIGPDRHPITMLSGKENLKNGNAPVNLIHLNDCVLILKQIIRENQWEETLNAVHPEHPTKEHYYTRTAIAKGLEPPKYGASIPKNHKIIYSCSIFLTNIHANFTSL